MGLQCPGNRNEAHNYPPGHRTESASTPSEIGALFSSSPESAGGIIRLALIKLHNFFTHCYFIKKANIVLFSDSGQELDSRKPCLFAEKDTDDEPSQEPVGYVKRRHSAFFHAEVDDTLESEEDFWGHQAMVGISPQGATVLEASKVAVEASNDVDFALGENYCNSAVSDDTDKLGEDSGTVQTKKILYLSGLIRNAYQQRSNQLDQALLKKYEISLGKPQINQRAAQPPGSYDLRRSKMEKRPMGPDPMDALKVRKD